MQTKSIIVGLLLLVAANGFLCGAYMPEEETILRTKLLEMENKYNWAILLFDKENAIAKIDISKDNGSMIQLLNLMYSEGFEKQFLSCNPSGMDISYWSGENGSPISY